MFLPFAGKSLLFLSSLVWNGNGSVSSRAHSSVVVTFCNISFHLLNRGFFPFLDYFCNVLEALEVTPSQILTHINVLLKASPDK